MKTNTAIEFLKLQNVEQTTAALVLSGEELIASRTPQRSGPFPIHCSQRDPKKLAVEKFEGG